MTKKKIVWRLENRPTPSEVESLVNSDIITKEEAREILFSQNEGRDEKSLKSEIKFLRDLVEKLSKDKTSTTTIIKEIEVPYKRYNWYQPYEGWCGGAGTIPLTTGTLTTGTNLVSCSGTSDTSFNSIKTF